MCIILDSLQTRLATLHAELAELRQRRQQQEIEIANIENVKLRQRFQEILDNLLTQEMQKVQEVINNYIVHSVYIIDKLPFYLFYILRDTEVSFFKE